MSLQRAVSAAGRFSLHELSDVELATAVRELPHVAEKIHGERLRRDLLAEAAESRQGVRSVSKRASGEVTRLPT